MKPRTRERPVILVQHMKCLCCARDKAFKIAYNAREFGIVLIDVRQFCLCQIEDETLERLCMRAAQEHHEGQLI